MPSSAKILLVASFGFLFPTGLFADAPKPTRDHAPRTKNTRSIPFLDMELSQNRTLRGQVVNSSGKGLPGIEVRLIQPDREPLRQLTRQDGTFQFSGVRAASCVVQLGDTTYVQARVWAQGTAPPAAHEVLLLSSEPVVRGQGTIWTRERVILVGAAIGGGVAAFIYQSNHDSPSSP